MAKRQEMRVGMFIAGCLLLCGCTPPDPGRPTGLMHSRQTGALYSMSQIRLQQVLAGEKGVVDQDHDGIPEFCLLGELAGELVPRGRRSRILMAEPFLPSGYNTGGANGKGYAERKGYYFRIYLPQTPDTAGDDKTLGGTDKTPGPEVRPDVIDLQEKHFAMYAWPSRAGTIPKYAMAFFINEKGVIHCQEGTKYIGEENAPPAEDAYSGHVFTSEVSAEKWPVHFSMGRPPEK